LALARLELMRKNYPAVLQHANKALAIRPNDPNARLFRVIGLTGTHSYVQAKTEAEQLAAIPRMRRRLRCNLGLSHWAKAVIPRLRTFPQAI
jgi:Flp pilus assembly protein TadD